MSRAIRLVSQIPADEEGKNGNLHFYCDDQCDTSWKTEAGLESAACFKHYGLFFHSINFTLIFLLSIICFKMLSFCTIYFSNHLNYNKKYLMSCYYENSPMKEKATDAFTAQVTLSFSSLLCF